MSAANCTWDQVVLTTGRVDGYNVYIKKSGSTYQKKNSSLVSDSTSPSYKVTNLSPGSYSGYATAVKGQNESERSNIDSFTISFDDRYKPEGLSSTVVSSDVTLGWDYVPGITEYKVYLDSGAGFVDQGAVYNNSLEITGLSAGSYDWYVAAVYDSQEVDSETETFTI